MLVQQRRLDGRRTSPQACCQIGRMKVVAHGFGTQDRQQRMRPRPFGRHQVHRTKAAGVVEGDAGAALKIQHDMIMLGRCGVGMMECAQCRARDQKPPRHAQMDQQRLGRRKIGEDVLRPPPQGDNLRPGQPLGHSRRKGPAQVGAAHIGLQDTPVGHHRFQPPAHGFDLGQFGHRVLRTDRRIAAPALRPIRGATPGRARPG